MNARAVAAKVVTGVAGERRSLSALLPPALARVPCIDRPLLQELCYGVLRWYPRLDALAARLLRKPITPRERDVHSLLLVGIYQLLHLGVPEHAAVDATVEAARELGRPWAVSLVNGVLRSFQRERERLIAEVDRREDVALAHPRWLYERLAGDWPEEFRAVLAAANRHPPMGLRINAARTDRDAYLARLASEGIAAQPLAHTTHGLVLAQAMDATRLPGFAEGAVSVQDGAAQLAATLLGARAGERVLDACAAPGGKTAHLLELEPALAALVALDRDADRLVRVGENLERLGLQAQLAVGDAAEPQAWWDGEPFDRILLDAPCSATGVIRRHPDIKLLRGPRDIEALALAQARLLDALWPLLRRGGTLLYATCSVLRAENDRQIGAFLERHADARERPIAADWGRGCNHGRQILPGEDQMDGFYYALLERC
jgi:16S rRNA (cytosine967-C5)-methyltransferase